MGVLVRGSWPACSAAAAALAWRRARLGSARVELFFFGATWTPWWCVRLGAVVPGGVLARAWPVRAAVGVCMQACTCRHAAAALPADSGTFRRIGLTSHLAVRALLAGRQSSQTFAAETAGAAQHTQAQYALVPDDCAR